MIGLDTNILVRLITEDDPRQRDVAIALLDDPDAETAVVNVLVLAELVWVLQRSYKFDRAWIATAVERLMRHPKIHVPEKDLVREAVHRSREAGDGIADSLIALVNRAHGCRTTMTFDADAALSDDFELLSS